MSAVSFAPILAVLVTALVDVDSIRRMGCGFFAVGPLVVLMQFGSELGPTTSQDVHKSRRMSMLLLLGVVAGVALFLA
jgi:hypothetical protein